MESRLRITPISSITTTCFTYSRNIGGLCVQGDIGFKYHALALLAVHHHPQRVGKVQVAYAFPFLDRGLVGEPFPIDCAFSCVGIDREVANLKRGEVLKEVAALGRSHAE